MHFSFRVIFDQKTNSVFFISQQTYIVQLSVVLDGVELQMPHPAVCDQGWGPGVVQETDGLSDQQLTLQVTQWQPINHMQKLKGVGDQVYTCTKDRKILN